MAQAQATAGDVDAAEQTLDKLPIDEQQKPEVKHLRGRMYFDRIAVTANDSAALLTRLDTEPKDSEARYQLAAHQVMDSDTENAMDNLLKIMQTDRKFGDDAARQALLKLFDMLGDDPAVTRYRARMFNLLH